MNICDISDREASPTAAIQNEIIAESTGDKCIIIL